MANFKVVKHFRDREGKDLEKLSPKQVAALKVYQANVPYESEDKKWTDYLVKEGYLKSTNEKTTVKEEVEPKEDKPKRTTRKKASE